MADFWKKSSFLVGKFKGSGEEESLCEIIFANAKKKYQLSVMLALRFLSRVAFICNICFLLAVLLLWMDNPPEGDLISLVIVIGFVLAFIVNLIVNISYGINLLLRKKPGHQIPSWLMLANFIFLIPELILLLK
jgi:hypothetical protein